MDNSDFIKKLQEENAYLKSLNYELEQKIKNLEKQTSHINISEQLNDNIYKWLDENIEYKYGYKLKLKDIVIKITHQQNNHSSVANKIRKEVEKWVQIKYPNEIHEMKHTKLKNKTFRGWFNFNIISNN